MTDALIVNFDEVEEKCGEAVWRKLPFGVRLKLRPQTGLVGASAEAQIARDLYLLQQGEDVLERYGFDPDDVSLLQDKDISLGFAMILRVTVRGVSLIEAWNLQDENKVPIEINAETVRKLFHLGVVPGSGPILMMAFQRMLDSPSYELADEKNGSGSSLNGATAEGRNTAETAGQPAKRARSAAGAAASSAPKSKTPPKPPKAS